MHRLYGERPLLAFSKLFSARAEELRGGAYIQCNLDIGALTTELFGVRFPNDDKLISIPYVEALEDFVHPSQFSSLEDAGNFAQTPEADDAIARTISTFNMHAEQLYRQHPTGLPRSKLQQLLCVSGGYYGRLGGKVDINTVSVQSEPKMPQTLLPPAALKELIAWDFPESYPEAASHPSGPVFESKAVDV